MIDHLGIKVRDFAKSKAFYLQALAPLGYGILKEFSLPDVDVAGFGEIATGKPDFWISNGDPHVATTHVSFRAETRGLVDSFHEAGLAAGGTDHGAPGVRAHYHPSYYGAFLLDPDGYNVEAVCHLP